ncbi:flagellar hook-associated protein FlgL [Candidatus Clostridium stratigraminis]|uniref:Flagellar hook-associated protein FlgL n=1 Tax=Candidatus Clostridium stratigraminis TaxID=3381661 RepID=A0ABW8T6U9_9CLOT
MRVTNKMLSNSFLADMNTNLQNMQKLQKQMTSGKEINKPSDDPAKVARAMQLTTDISANEQYNKNINNTTNWLDTTDTALNQAGNVLQKVRELLVSAGNAAYGSSERQSIKDEINQRIDELTQILNTNYDGKYVFGGTSTSTKPVATIAIPDNLGNLVNKGIDYNATAPDPSDPKYTGPTDPLYITDLQNYNIELNKINKKMTVEISQGVTMEYNVTAGDLLEFNNESGAACDLRSILKGITEHLDGNVYDGTNWVQDPAAATSELPNNDLQGITDTINNLLKIRSQVGAKQNRMENSASKNQDENFNLTSILSKTEDIDITQKTMEYATMQTVYMASLQTSARVIQPTLLDFLK